MACIMLLDLCNVNSSIAVLLLLCSSTGLGLPAEEFASFLPFMLIHLLPPLPLHTVHLHHFSWQRSWCAVALLPHMLMSGQLHELLEHCPWATFISNWAINLNKVLNTSWRRNFRKESQKLPLLMMQPRHIDMSTYLPAVHVQASTSTYQPSWLIIPGSTLVTRLQEPSWIVQMQSNSTLAVWSNTKHGWNCT